MESGIKSALQICLAWHIFRLHFSDAEYFLKIQKPKILLNIPFGPVWLFGRKSTINAATHFKSKERIHLKFCNQWKCGEDVTGSEQTFPRGRESCEKTKKYLHLSTFEVVSLFYNSETVEGLNWRNWTWILKKNRWLNVNMRNSII